MLELRISKIASRACLVILMLALHSSTALLNARVGQCLTATCCAPIYFHHGRAMPDSWLGLWSVGARLDYWLRVLYCTTWGCKWPCCIVLVMTCDAYEQCATLCAGYIRNDDLAQSVHVLQRIPHTILWLAMKITLQAK